MSGLSCRLDLLSDEVSGVLNCGNLLSACIATRRSEQACEG